MVTVRLEPDDGIADLLRRSDRSVENGARDLIVTELYRRGAISRGKVAELLGVSLDAFLRHAASLGIPYVNYAEEERAVEKREVEWITGARTPATPAG